MGCRVRLLSPLLFDWRHSTQASDLQVPSRVIPDVWTWLPSASGRFTLVLGNLRGPTASLCPEARVVSRPEPGALAPAASCDGLSAPPSRARSALGRGDFP